MMHSDKNYPFAISRRDLIYGSGAVASSILMAMGIRSVFRDPPPPVPKSVNFSFKVVTVTPTGRINNQQTKTIEGYQQDLGEGVLLDMIQIPTGSFLMGSLPSEESSGDYEGPQHQVFIPQSFWMGRYTVTQAQWRAVATLPKIQNDLDPDPSNFKGADRPVEQVSWFAAVEFCARLSEFTGRDYRLPTEAEWEYACRAGTTTPFHFGSTITTDLANYCGSDNDKWDRSDSYGSGPNGVYRKETTGIGSFDVANNFGLYDMHGNVWEWCADGWSKRYKNYGFKPSNLMQNGSLPWFDPIDGGSHALLRGGSWTEFPRDCRSACRNFTLRFDSRADIGFRLVCAGPRDRKRSNRSQGG